MHSHTNREVQASGAEHPSLNTGDELELDVRADETF
jgi:hypothetical protein